MIGTDGIFRLSREEALAATEAFYRRLAPCVPVKLCNHSTYQGLCSAEKHEVIINGNSGYPYELNFLIALTSTIPFEDGVMCRCCGMML